MSHNSEIEEWLENEIKAGRINTREAIEKGIEAKRKEIEKREATLAKPKWARSLQHDPNSPGRDMEAIVEHLQELDARVEALEKK